MKIIIDRNGLKLISEGVPDDIYIEDVLKLKSNGDGLTLVRADEAGVIHVRSGKAAKTERPVIKQPVVNNTEKVAPVVAPPRAFSNRLLDTGKLATSKEVFNKDGLKISVYPEDGGHNFTSSMGGVVNSSVLHVKVLDEENIKRTMIKLFGEYKLKVPTDLVKQIIDALPKK
jgi:hypothetical protein